MKARRVCCICFGLSGGFAIQESFRFTSGFEPVSELTESHFFVKVIWQRGLIFRGTYLTGNWLLLSAVF